MVARLPAICVNPICGTVFPSGFGVGGTATVNIAGSRAGPCPRCGSMGRIPDGKYSAIAETLYANLNDVRDIQALRRLQGVIRSAIKNNDFTSTKKKLSAIEPKWSNVWGLLPENNVATALAVYMFVLTLIQTAISFYAVLDTTDSATFIDQSFQNYYELCPPIPQQDNRKESPRFPLKPLTQDNRKESSEFRLKPLTEAIKRTLI